MGKKENKKKAKVLKPETDKDIMDKIKKEFSTEAWKKTLNHKNYLNDSYANKIFSIIIRAKFRKLIHSNLNLLSPNFTK